MKTIPILNDSFNIHLTLADWESLHFSHLAIDALSLLIRSSIVIPKNATAIFFDTRVRSCHKVSASHVLSSPFDGRKIPITPEKLNDLFQMLSKKYPKQQFVWVDKGTLQEPIMLDNEQYRITEKPGQDAAKGLLYEVPENTACHCYTCENFTPEYLKHLEHVGVPLGLRLSLLHNLAVGKPLSHVSTSL